MHGAEHGAVGLAGGDHVAGIAERHRVEGGGVDLAAAEGLPAGGGLGLAGGPGFEVGLLGGVHPLAAGQCLAGVLEGFGGDEVVQGSVGGEAQGGLHQGELVGAEAARVRGGDAAELGRRRAAHGAECHQGGPAGALGGLAQGGLEGIEVGGGIDLEHAPSVGPVPGSHVFAEGLIGAGVDGDAVVVPDQHEVVETEGAGQARRLTGDALLQATVAGERRWRRGECEPADRSSLRSWFSLIE